MKKLRERGALFVEYALILAFVTVIGVNFVGGDTFTKPITRIFNKAEALLQGKQYIDSSYSFWQAVADNGTEIYYNGNTYEGILNYMVNAGSDFTSGAALIHFPSAHPAVVDGVEYKNASEAITAALQSAGYIGHEDITWSMLKGNLYVADRKYTNEDLNTAGTFKVMKYNVQDKEDKGTEVNAHLKKSSKANYVFIEPIK